MPAVDQAPPAAPKLVLHWRHRVTGQTGHGEPQSTGVVLAHVEDANKRFPDILHWAEPVPPACEDCNDTGTITDPAPDAPGARPPEPCVSCPGRTLPVTPAERHLATALRAWLEWCNDGAQMKGTEDATMMDMWPVLQERGFVTEHYGQPTPTGAALLARVEEAPVLEPTAAIVAFIRAEETRYRRNSWDSSHDAAGRERCANKASVLATVAAYIERGDHLAPPIDAPPAKEPR